MCKENDGMDEYRGGTCEYLTNSDITRETQLPVPRELGYRYIDMCTENKHAICSHIINDGRVVKLDDELLEIEPLEYLDELFSMDRYNILY